MKGANLDHEQIGECLKQADFTVENNGTLKELHGKLGEILKELSD